MPMRILHIDTGMTMRGGQQLLLLLARGLRERGHWQTIACPPWSPLSRKAVAEGLPVLAIERGYLGAARTVRRLVRDEAVEIASAHDAHAQTISVLATLGTNVVRVANRQVMFAPSNRLVHRWKYTHTCDAVVTTSQVVKDALIGNGVPAGHIEVIRGGIEYPAELAPPEARARMRANWGLGQGDFVIGHVAAFTAEKGQREALEALLRLLPQYKNMRMILAGDGPLRGDARMKALVLATKGAAQTPGFIEPDADFYAGLDLFLANSTSEALGLAPLYAMAHEVPVVASKVGGLPEVVGDTGWLIPPSDAEALAAAIEQAIADPARRLEFARLAREHSRGFTIEAAIDQTEALYHRLVKP